MFTSIEECTDFIFNLKATQFKGEPLEAIRNILAHLGNPHEKVQFVHIAGSNGKGSTLNALKQMLIGAGYRVGAFISPHLERVNERITISGEEVSDEQFLAYMNQLVEVIETYEKGQYPSFFELMTIVSFMHFHSQHVDIALIETGIGGRLDSTNVITPMVSVITTVSLEHTEILGDTFEKVAFEKAGIIKKTVPVVTTVKNEEAIKVIREVAKQKQSPYYVLNDQFQILHMEIQEKYQSFDYKLEDIILRNVVVGMPGIHQIENASLALTVAIILRKYGYEKLTEGVLREALATAHWPGRFEHMSNQIIIDGAHNSEGTAALIHTLKEVYPNYNYKFIYAALSDKDHGKSIAMMDEVASSMSFTEIQLPRAAKAKDLAKQSCHPKVAVDEDWMGLIERETKKVPDNELLVITGSLYFIADVRKYLQKRTKN